MKILHISPYSPVPPTSGGPLRIFHLLKGLARQHDVTFVTLGTDKDRESLKKEFGNRIQVVNHTSIIRRHPLLSILYALLTGRSYVALNVQSEEMQRTIDGLFETEHFDLVLSEFPVMGFFKLPDNVVKILDEHNVEYCNLYRMYRGYKSLFRKLFYLREYRKMFRLEIDTCNNSDAVFVTSRNDGEILKNDINDKPVYVIPNGVDTTYFVPSDDKIEPSSMVFTGTLEYGPNRDAMLYFLNEIFPLVKKTIPEARIYIVGKNPPDELKRRSAKDIIVTGFVDDVRPYVWKSSVYVVPLRMGSGTRLKILEGLAMKKAMVTTSIGCEGIDVKDGEDVLIADDPVSFAAKVVDLLQNRQKTEWLGSNGYRTVTSSYNWDVIASSMNETIASITNQSLNESISQADDRKFSKKYGELERVGERISAKMAVEKSCEFKKEVGY